MKTKPIPIALPADLLQQVDDVQHLTGMSKADIMRLCMRIGLIDLRAAEHDLPGIVKDIADDKGVSFQHWAAEKTEPKFSRQTGTQLSKKSASETENLHDSPSECHTTNADTADSTNTFPTNPPTPETCQNCAAAAASRSGYPRPLESQPIDDTATCDRVPFRDHLSQTSPPQEERLA